MTRFAFQKNTVAAAGRTGCLLGSNPEAEPSEGCLSDPGRSYGELNQGSGPLGARKCTGHRATQVLGEKTCCLAEGGELGEEDVKDSFWNRKSLLAQDVRSHH